MLFAVGWCVLQSSRSVYATTSIADIDAVDAAVDSADAELWTAFRRWMEANCASEWTLNWTLHEHHNNHHGLLQAYVSRNHRPSPFWQMLEWITVNGPGSYGLFYVHDDQDIVGPRRYRRGTADFDNVFRVHRIMNGCVEELADPFFGPIIPNLEPTHPYDRNLAAEE